MNKLKKVFTKKHVFLVNEKESKGNDDCIYGQNLLLSIYVSVSALNNAKSGNFIYSESIGRIVRNEDVISIEEPNDNDLAFFEYMKEHKEVAYSNKIVNDFHLKDYLIYVDGKAKNN
ncbi:hypothetical protein M4L90_12265 [Staphylococcus equorum]|uniref:Uncharacterized protein n=1 Tax=Staphylococcus equorum TaxID=246432 RepID=A0A9X4QZP4_9STAP|nr:hypothetical protein [Staphylococcus equorum]MDG0820694.1 hypothetical protein [Staphylococcus equorum]MDG0841319.1 hypothetical protein [Staphylococcus equorum]MDG0847019.1 hypothetical protein [Staphylococcus equorum]